MKAKTILVPVDFSSSADTALDCATALAKSFDADLAIVHVEVAPVLSGAYDDEDDPEQNRLHHLLENVTPCDPAVTFKRSLLKGVVADEIVGLAEDHRANMIVMGTHGITNSPDAVMGTVAEAVTRRAPCLVIAVKPAAKSAATMT